MGRYTGPVCRLCRREGEKLLLKGSRCLSSKCPFEKDRGYPPGEHGRISQFRTRRRSSDYQRQLREKQKARRMYGVMERQFRRYFANAAHAQGLTGENLLSMLERRLDNIVYRLGWAGSRAQARQLVSHGHFVVNGYRTKVASYVLDARDVLSVREGSRGSTYFRERIEQLDEGAVPGWLSQDLSSWTARVLAVPARDDIDTPLNEQLIVEYYSAR
jgi:small subunit ribosomal protein S4